MKNKTNWLIYSLLVTIGLFIYLTYHHYAVQLGTNAPGFCSISSTLNCDAAANSVYSEVFKIPIALLGFCFNLVMLVIVLFKKMGWSDENPTQNAFLKVLFLLSAGLSIVLGLISIVQIKVVCPFCLATYVFSFVNLYLAWSVFKPADFDIMKTVSDSKTWITGFAILGIAWLISSAIQDKYGLKEIKLIIPQKTAQWQNAPVNTFSNQLGIVQNPDAKITLVEFADFKCSHCKEAYESLHKFMEGRTDIQFVFKNFPLDGTCNPHVQFKGDGSRCKMASWSLCAEKVAQKGWAVHNYYFDNQHSLEGVSDMKETNMALAQKLNLNFEEVEKCSESVTTYDEIKKMADEAVAAKVQGTPTIFLNGKKTEMRPEYLPLVLKSIAEGL